MTLTFDKPKLLDLKLIYCQAMVAVLELLPFAPAKRKEVIFYFQHTHWITLPDLKIATLTVLRDNTHSNNELRDDLTGLIEYLKMKYMVKNYIDFILRNNGAINITGGMQSNHQPAPQSPEILNCLIERN